MAEHEVTRQILKDTFPLAVKAVFYGLAAISTAVFLVGVLGAVRRYRGGRPDPARLTAAGLWRALWAAGGLRSRLLRGDGYAGLAHLLIFWGFLVEFAGTLVVALDYDVARRLGFSFFRGAFYEVVSLLLDLLGVALLAGLLLMAARRAFFPPARLVYARADGRPDPARGRWTAEDWLLLGLLALITLGGFLVEGWRILADRPSFEAAWSPVGWRVADLLAAAGLTPAEARALHARSWWVHALLALTFVAALPHTKARHMLAALAALALGGGRPGRALPPAPEGSAGYATVADLTWRELLMLDACTRCGRCHEACPARAAGAPLSPRDVVLDLRAAAVSRRAGEAPGAGGGAAGGAAPAAGGAVSVAATGAGSATPLPGGAVSAGALWSCTTCLACVERCPVGVEHVPVIVQLRRHLVDQGELDGNLQETLMRLQRQGNSFGQSERLRARWTGSLGFPVKDARREEVEWLWFVGDYASFDPRAQEVTRAVARLLRGAGVDFGLLHEGERNAGNDVRRVGEEGLFELLAEHNLKQMARARFRAIVTTDPHSYNALRNEYPAFGLPPVPVLHHTELLLGLLREGRLGRPRPLGVRATYHDPCYLGRYNGVFDAPRQLLAAVGAEVVEMPRHREGSFCCGAGGGRIWMGDDLYRGEKPAVQRIREAAALGVSLFVVACPKDLAMFQDAVKTAGLEGKMEVRDVAQLVEEAVAPAAATERAAAAGADAAPGGSGEEAPAEEGASLG